MNGDTIIKYSGDNVQNNNVFVDFKKKMVVFEPVSKLSELKIFTINSFSVFAAFLPLFYFIYAFILLFQNSIFDKLVFSIFFGIIIFFIPIIINLQMYNKKWRNEYYPRFMAGIIALCRLYTFDFRFILGKRVKPNDLVGNVYIIPKFANVALKYTLVGDFADKIEHINVKCLDEKGHNFFAVFTFSTPVQTGYMKLNYI